MQAARRPQQEVVAQSLLRAPGSGLVAAASQPFCSPGRENASHPRTRSRRPAAAGFNLCCAGFMPQRRAPPRALRRGAQEKARRHWCGAARRVCVSPRKQRTAAGAARRESSGAGRRRRWGSVHSTRCSVLPAEFCSAAAASCAACDAAVPVAAAACGHALPNPVSEEQFWAEERPSSLAAAAARAAAAPRCGLQRARWAMDANLVPLSLPAALLRRRRSPWSLRPSGSPPPGSSRRCSPRGRGGGTA